ncbi:MAG: hypothetical protein DWQ44_01200 [Bacteroidetes bacterium]|nr:MAG: hypothetical protein DWQ33_00665 [Bacteroidota bacterium]REK04966.1 MAG: hypothetical protein DWQ39_07055 [Bacteroidota bacterium]REK36530.1 MAG: hypothetical protein DWQ44_01200 [Bacteroidota bacterium]REK50896.1 MAG: hypothetical protein DWQ48_02060 [Bacteroidota bacterium]
MAVIGKIRKRVGLLIAFIGVSLLLFILGDVLSTNTGLLSGQTDVIGEIGGNEVHYQEFEKRVERLTENYKINTQSDNIDQNTQDMLREQAWGMYVNENTLGEEYKKIGISVSSAELYDMCTGPNPHAQVRQAFTDPNTQMFDPTAVVKFLKDLPNRDESVQRQWRQFEDAIMEERISSKYKEMIKAGLYVTKAEAKAAMEESQRTASIRFVRLDYNTIPDSAAVVEEKDLKAYHSANQHKYTQTETIRKIDYVTFDVSPSAEDHMEVINWINEKVKEFEQAEDHASFVNQYSDAPFDSNYYKRESFPAPLDTLFGNVPVGTMVGPYTESSYMKISKLTGIKNLPDSVRARHILIKIQNNDTTAARNKADSLKNAIRRGSKFSDLATKFSEDPGSAVKGGDLDWFQQGMMVKEFNDACFEGKKGDMPIVVTQFGVHLIEVLDKGAPSRTIQVATVMRNIEPSQRTYDAAYNKANQFAATNNTALLFDSAVVKQGLNKRIADNIRETDKNIPGLESPRELIRWVYSAKVGDVSKAFTIGEKFVIAKLTDIREKGNLPLDAVREQVMAEARKIKKADMLVEKIKNAGASDLDALAQKLSVNVMDAENISFQNPYVPGIGGEAKVVGAIFGSKEGQMSAPIRGDLGVTVFSVKSFTAPAQNQDIMPQIKQLTEQRTSRSEYEVFNALKEKVGITDNRGKFY